MKKSIILGCFIVFSFSLTSCNNNENIENKSNKEFSIEKNENKKLFDVEKEKKNEVEDKKFNGTFIVSQDEKKGFNDINEIFKLYGTIKQIETDTGSININYNTIFSKDNFQSFSKYVGKLQSSKEIEIKIKELNEKIDKRKNYLLNKTNKVLLFGNINGTKQGKNISYNISELYKNKIDLPENSKLSLEEKIINNSKYILTYIEKDGNKYYLYGKIDDYKKIINFYKNIYDLPKPKLTYTKQNDSYFVTGFYFEKEKEFQSIEYYQENFSNTVIGYLLNLNNYGKNYGNFFLTKNSDFFIGSNFQELVGNNKTDDIINFYNELSNIYNLFKAIGG